MLAIDREAEESSAAVAARVASARSRQLERQGCTNSLLEPGQLEALCRLSGDDRKFLETASEKLALSPRAIHRVLKVARTIADLDDHDSLSGAALTEALAYRSAVTKSQSL